MPRMWSVRTQRDLDRLRAHVEWAIQHKIAMTVTYKKLEIDEDAGETEQDRIVVRTVEPWELLQSAKGHWYMRSMCRHCGVWKSRRLAQILTYTVHRGGRRTVQDLK